MVVHYNKWSEQINNVREWLSIMISGQSVARKMYVLCCINRQK